MNRKPLTIVLVCSMMLASCINLAGCGKRDVSEGAADTGISETQTEPENSEAESSGTGAETAGSDLIDYDLTDAGPGINMDQTEEENPFDGGPDWVSLAYRFTLPTDSMSVEDAVTAHAITMTEGGIYADYEGDIGDVIPDYKDKDLDGDHKPDVINRVGDHYEIEFTRLDTLITHDYIDSPNEGEVFEFDDLACRNLDEIFVEHYTFGTGGSNVWDTYLYSWQDGEWVSYPLVDKEGVINSKELRAYIEGETGAAYSTESVRIAGISLSTLLLDFGKKDGPEYIHDYRTAYLYKSFFPEYMDDSEEFSCTGLSADLSLISTWPYELTGEAVNMTSELQKKLNVFLTNFSEVSFRDEDWPNSYAHFALEWSRLNDMSKVVMRDDRYCISHSNINQILSRYMGTNLEEGDMSDIICDDPERHYGSVEYTDGEIWYTEPLADGEMYKYNHITVVNDAQKLHFDHSDYVRLEFTTYSLETDVYDEVGNAVYYPTSPAEAEKLVADGTLIKNYDGLAYAQDVGSDGYWLMYYRIYD